MPSNLKQVTRTETALVPVRCYVLFNMSPEYINSVAGVVSTKAAAEAWKAQDAELRDYECFHVVEEMDSK